MMTQKIKKHAPLTIAYIKRRLEVNIVTGRCYWKDPSKHHMRLLGKEAGCKRYARRGKYYWIIKLGGIGYLRSQIIYAVKTGKWPKSSLDHKNGNSLDDRASNIRAATFLENARNRSVGYAGKVLPMGIRKCGDKYQARIRVNKVGLHLGTFLTLTAANAAYLSARKQYFKEFA